MKRSILYVHGKGGTADEADHYRSLCPGYEVFGLDYKGYMTEAYKRAVKLADMRKQ